MGGSAVLTCAACWGWPHPVPVHLHLQGGPRRVLIVKKPVPAAGAQLEEMATWLQQQGLQVGVLGEG